MPPLELASDGSCYSKACMLVRVVLILAVRSWGPQRVARVEAMVNGLGAGAFYSAFRRPFARVLSCSEAKHRASDRALRAWFLVETILQYQCWPAPLGPCERCAQPTGQWCETCNDVNGIICSECEYAGLECVACAAPPKDHAAGHATAHATDRQDRRPHPDGLYSRTNSIAALCQTNPYPREHLDGCFEPGYPCRSFS